MKTVVFTIKVPLLPKKCYRKVKVDGWSRCSCAHYCNREREAVCPIYDPDEVLRLNRAWTEEEHIAFWKVAENSFGSTIGESLGYQEEAENSNVHNQDQV